jgi:hypothetical protein
MWPNPGFLGVAATGGDRITKNIMLLLAPLLLAAPLAREFGGTEVPSSAAPPLRGVLVAGVVIAPATISAAI